MCEVSEHLARGGVTFLYLDWICGMAVQVLVLDAEAIFNLHTLLDLCCSNPSSRRPRLTILDKNEKLKKFSDVMASRSSPGSRQKSCNSCVQAKRRCDRQAPVCMRCIQKKTPCIYGNIQRFTRYEMEALDFMDSVYSPSNANPSLQLDYSGLDGDNPVDADATTVQNIEFDSINDTYISKDYFMDLINGNDEASGSQWLVRADHEIVEERAGSPVDKEIQRAYKNMDALCVSLFFLSLNTTLAFPLCKFAKITKSNFFLLTPFQGTQRAMAFIRSQNTAFLYR
jgi:hypothetical protein